jgi:hypothetical protein
MKKGQRCPFDTAVAINIGQYRLETLKFDLCDSLVATFEAQLATFEREVATLREMNTNCETEIIRKNTVIEAYRIEYDIINKAYAREKTWFRKNEWWVGFGVGVVAGSVATYYIIR